MKSKPELVFLLLLLPALAFGQMNQYSYRRPLEGIDAQWHRLTLPDELFARVDERLSDIRIYGITPAGDTIEAPYLLRVANATTTNKAVASRILNTSHNEQGYYFTFEVPTHEPINQLLLDFEEQNFDWKVRLEASHQQLEWFTVADHYRILSIHNELTDFSFTRIAFPTSSYRYYRLLVPALQKPRLVAASVVEQQLSQATLKNYPLRSMTVTQLRDRQQTLLTITLPARVPVSQLKIHVSDTFDYYRPVTIERVSDSIRTSQGWHYNSRLLGSGTLNSLTGNELTFDPTLAQTIRVYIGNNDNQPLAIGRVEAKGPLHELLIRFTQPASYFLVYGLKGASRPQYDLGQLTTPLPASLTALQLGSEQPIRPPAPLTTALFQNKAWLWLIMALIISLLAWATVNMMRKKVKQTKQ